MWSNRIFSGCSKLHPISIRGRRNISLSRRINSHLSISEEVQQAFADKKPVVALESTIITHGLPYPENIKMAQQVEAIIRKNGAVPATTAFIKGVPTVGLGSASVLEYLASTKDSKKVSRRDIPYVVANKLYGGTTIASTMILAHMAGIKVFATGGLGGVHRGAEITMDISADLEELGRTPVAVVCAGPKSILDISKTMEYLETKGVHVSTMGDPGTNIPGFYCRDSGVSSPYNFSTPYDAASVIHAGHQLELGSGSVFCVPAPEDIALDSKMITSVINDAVKAAENAGIFGKDITPFLLKKVWEATNGKSLTSNVGFVLNNAYVATQIAKELNKLEYGIVPELSEESKRQELTDENFIPSNLDLQPVILKRDNQRNSGDLVDSMVIGGLALDLTCKFQKASTNKSFFRTSNPGKIETSIGGVGYNVALAAAYSGKKYDQKTRLVSAVSKKDGGADVIRQIQELGHLDSAGVLIDDSGENMTARYIAMHDDTGELVVACADMDILENINLNHIEKEIKRGKPSWIIFDSNIGIESFKKIMDISKDDNINAKVGFEPTSVPKVAKLAKVNLRVFPNNDIDLSTPNALELDQMFTTFHENDRFDVDNWFPVIDSIGVNEDFRNKLDFMAKTNPDMSEFVTTGMYQQAIHMLPYIPNLLIKNGSKGVVLCQLLEDIDSTLDSLDPKLPIATAFCRGSATINGKHTGVLIQHFPATTVDTGKVVSVTGAGDTFCGVLLSELSKNPSWLLDSGKKKLDAVNRAQACAALTIQSNEAVSKAIIESRAS
ncbi:hypothetical protein NADFUDRAFT_50584 [Nadsonia fulvescens var. elongata DSM 6958]|uniref:Carbohydrate kinase PfkB domain-containing protein n=1 Tax=Nadsonia fulvescens var. elongata DSM 6958 TaxID=857566 RepID=A0A1E3PN73_9ASCO|nr:hypothetical protein NADFUDRAFT_50584 [Nadsonia fulvescens var. elongata DSM 6958]